MDDGSYSIDPSELFRVYSPVDQVVAGKHVHTLTEYVNPTGHIQTELLRDLIEQVKSERDYLRKRLDDTESSRQRMELELT